MNECLFVSRGNVMGQSTKYLEADSKNKRGARAETPTGTQTPHVKVRIYTHPVQRGMTCRGIQYLQ